MKMKPKKQQVGRALPATGVTRYRRRAEPDLPGFSQSEHGVPHFHAMYGEFNGVFAIETQEMLEGDLPIRAQRLVKEWTTRYTRELLDMWTRQEFGQLPGLD